MKHPRSDNDDEDLFDIRPERLEKEILRHPRLSHRYALKLADARREHELAKRERDDLAAKLSRDIRERPDEYGLTKVTEDSLKELVRLDAAVSDAELAVIDSKHKIDVLYATVNALEEKRRMIEAELQIELRIHHGEVRGSERLRRDEPEAFSSRRSR